MGDAMGVIFAKSLKNMPFLESINLTDNNLSGLSLNPIIEAFSSIHSLTYLNMTCNEINRLAATALATYVANNTTLASLILSQTDLDDYECQLFVVAATENDSLTELDLSNNEIGMSEISPVLKKRNGSGAEALAAILSLDDCRIESLNLRWNHIKLQGGHDLVRSLNHNTSLLHLDLAYNSLGNRAGEMLGSALLCNQTLVTLQLANNNIEGSGCFTICIGILENFSLKYVCLDNNPLAELGAVMLMQLPLDVGHRVKISAKNCNFIPVVGKEEDVLFDYLAPAADYELLLEDPFQRAIAIRLLNTVATTPQYKFNKFQYQKPRAPRAKGKTESRDIRLVASTSNEKLQHLSETNKEILKSLKSVQGAVGNLKEARRLFEKYDIDGNNSLDAQEMQKLLADLNVYSDIAAIEEAIKAYDIDGAGTIELGEFNYYLNAQAEEAARLIKHMTESKILVTRSRPGVKYIPPSTGKLLITLSRSYSSTDPPQEMTKSALDDCIAMVSDGNVGIKSRLRQFSIANVTLRKSEAVRLFLVMKEEIFDPVEAMAMILPRVLVAKEAASVLSLCLPDSKSQTRLRCLMGFCLNPLLVSTYILMTLVVAMFQIR
jgi:Ran GTPase-activating protein (RanGAP) involved in mRNA processing and transport